MSKKTFKSNFLVDTKLLLSIVVLWSVGRIVNPLRHFERTANGDISSTLAIGTSMYVLLHFIILLYTAWLIVSNLRTYGFAMKGKMLAVFVFYVYVILAIFTSLYFIGYEFGYIPTWLQWL